MPRLTPITVRAALAPVDQPVADKVTEVFGHIRGPFSMLLHSPKLAEQLLPLVTFVRHQTIIKPHHRFAGILTAARERNAAYVWAAQVEQAHKNGIREELIEVIRTQGDLQKLPRDEREIVNYVRQLMRTNRVDQVIFDALNSQHGAQWMVELTAMVNFFGFVAGICNAFEVQPPPDGDKLPA